ncbi:serpin family protein [Yeosuana marina]|uniref:serpin family protein n=1 Tax=Yeosuana marina TaxID=1565536 RepID=UPI00141E9858|nr:serpin family protein [Yeosuana marina]
MKLDHTLLLPFLICVITFQSCSTSNDEPLIPFDTVSKGHQIVSANNDFAFSLYKEIAQTETENNFMISPVSASLALGMVYNGTDGETKQAFASMFNYGNTTIEETNLVNQNIIENLTRTASRTTFDIANSLWIKNTFPVKESFLTTNKSYYFAEVQNKDFNDPQTLKTINNWVSNKTNGKIPSILDNISADAVLYAINAIYFKSDWEFRFKTENTKLLSFHLANGNVKQVEMMSMQQDLKYMANDIFSSVELPYKNNKYSMTLILPNTNKTFDDVMPIMNSENWLDWQNNFTVQDIKITLPKFKFSSKKEFNDALANLGLGIAFSNNANFSNLSNTDTKISFVLQKTFIDVNEKGTEAAAVTAVGIVTTSIGESKQFLLNKPFLFVITEKETGSICFMGKVGNPEY